MKQLSPEQIAWSRNMQSQILQGVDKRGQSVVADEIGVDSSTITRLKETHLSKLCDIMAVCGLKVVSMDMNCYQRDKVDMLFLLAKEHLTRMEQVDDFFHDDVSERLAEGSYRPRGKL